MTGKLEYDESLLLRAIEIQNDPSYRNRIERGRALGNFSVSKWSAIIEKARRSYPDRVVRNYNRSRRNSTPVDITRRGLVKKWIISTAQNNCPLHTGFVAAMRTWCKSEDGDLLTPLLYYRNESLFSEKEPTYWPHDVADGWLVDRTTMQGVDKELCPGLVVLGGLKTQATASNPFTSVHSLPENKTGVIPHSQVRVQSLPVRVGEKAKFLFSTGSCTLPRARDETKAGRLYTHHHQIAALIVETDGEDWWARHVIANDAGGFVDKDIYYNPKGSTSKANGYAGLVLGDVHVWHEDDDLEIATFEAGAW